MKTLIAIPCGDFCHTDFLRALLGLEIIGEAQFTFAQGSLVYDARNKLCDIAMEGGFDRVLWLDSDMSFPRDLLRRLSAHIDDGAEIVTGLCVTRKDPIQTTVYSDIGMRQDPGEKYPTPYRTPVQNIPDAPFAVAACGMAAVLMTTDLIRRVHEQFGLPFSPIAGFGEDLSFCIRARELGAKILCEPGPEIGHVGMHTYTRADLR